MADLDSLDYNSILEQSDDEALERLRQIRLNRTSPPKRAARVSPIKPATVKKSTNSLTAQQAAELLKILGK